MAFNKKHYKGIAAILLSARKEFLNHEVTAEQAIHCIEADLATMFAEDNPRFDSKRFLEASRNYSQEVLVDAV
tara:strand:+ start:563 stop:781 length:219 start_codon:yes stop_codon:yes gene_type:complete